MRDGHGWLITCGCGLWQRKKKENRAVGTKTIKTLARYPKDNKSLVEKV